MSRTAVVAGATGLVGSALVPQLCADDRYEHVVTVGRRPLEPAPEGLDQRTASFPDIAEALDGVTPDDAFCALGTTRKKAGKEGFYKVDHDYIVAFAQWAKQAGAKRLMLVSSVGANAQSPNFYLQVKGKTEDDIEALGFELFAAFRPGVLMGEREESRPLESIGIKLQKVLNPLLIGMTTRYRGMEIERLAQAMIAVAHTDASGKLVLEYDESCALLG